MQDQGPSKSLGSCMGIDLYPNHLPTASVPTPWPYSQELRVLRLLLPTGSEEREVLGVGNIPVAILPSCQDMKYIAL